MHPLGLASSGTADTSCHHNDGRKSIWAEGASGLVVGWKHGRRGGQKRGQKRGTGVAGGLFVAPSPTSTGSDATFTSCVVGLG